MPSTKQPNCQISIRRTAPALQAPRRTLPKGSRRFSVLKRRLASWRVANCTVVQSRSSSGFSRFFLLVAGLVGGPSRPNRTRVVCGMGNLAAHRWKSTAVARLFSKSWIPREMPVLSAIATCWPIIAGVDRLFFFTAPGTHRWPCGAVDPARNAANRLAEGNAHLALAPYDGSGCPRTSRTASMRTDRARHRAACIGTLARPCGVH